MEKLSITIPISFEIPVDLAIKFCTTETRGRNLRRMGLNPRALGLNPRKLGLSPSQIREAIQKAIRDRQSSSKNTLSQL